MKRVRIPLPHSIAISLAASVTSVLIYRVAVEAPAPTVVVVEAACPSTPAIKPYDGPTIERHRVPVRTPPPAPELDVPDAQDAKQRFIDAVDLLREERRDEGCALLESVTHMNGPDDRVWRDKAASLHARRCE